MSSRPIKVISLGLFFIFLILGGGGIVHYRLFHGLVLCGLAYIIDYKGPYVLPTWWLLPCR